MLTEETPRFICREPPRRGPNLDLGPRHYLWEKRVTSNVNVVDKQEVYSGRAPSL